MKHLKKATVWLALALFLLSVLPLAAGAEELRANRRASCARLRVAERLPDEVKPTIHH